MIDCVVNQTRCRTSCVPYRVEETVCCRSGARGQVARSRAAQDVPLDTGLDSDRYSPCQQIPVTACSELCLCNY